jgi:endoglucanase Acf2
MSLGRAASGLLCLILPAVVAAPAERTVAVGQGSVLAQLPDGAKEPPATVSKTENVRGPIPTNRWWSSLAWMDFSERQFPHPLAVRAQRQGLRVFFVGNRVVVSEKTIMGGMPGGDNREDLILGHSEQSDFPDARLDGHSDWFVRARFAVPGKSMTVSYGHGSPFVYALYEGGSPRISFAREADVWSGGAQSPAIGVTVDGKHYGLFGPSGSGWSWPDRRTAVNQSHGKPYFSLAVLPERSDETLRLFARHAHAHVADTRVAWKYDPATSTVETTFLFQTKPYEGSTTETLFALYPHQWRNTSTRLLDQQYPSIRGVMKLGRGASFVTRHVYPGVLPVLPRTASEDVDRLQALLADELKAQPGGPKDTYWEGKWLGKLATLAGVAEQAGDEAAAERFRTQLRQRLGLWFTATNAQGEPKRAGVFYYNRTWGTLIGYPAGYGSDVELNDHHFHYGYFLRAAAEVALRDPAWGRPERWGGVVQLLVRDIANPSRDDPRFPFLRNFDPYAGHSWACGHARFGDGNNQESSSEAMNAWCALILWGTATGDTALRDLGFYLFATELAAINAYWFDVLGENRPAEFPQTTLGILWGGKADYATWFSPKPESIHGINWLPFHGGSLYLGLYPEYVRKNYESLRAKKKGGPWDEWADLIWMYRALDDAPDALAQFNARTRLRPEAGNSKAHLYHWLTALRDLGHVDRHVTADTPLYAVFRKGDRRTYAVYNPRDERLHVRFSDGRTVTADKRGFHLHAATVRSP